MTANGNRWERDAGTGYYATVDAAGRWDERFYIVPGVMGNPATLFAYGNARPLARGTLAECMASAAPF